MNVLDFAPKEDFTSIILMFNPFSKSKLENETFLGLSIPTTISETKISDTTIILKEIKFRHRFIRFLKNKNVFIQDEKSFHALLNKLYQDEIQLLFEIVKRLFNNNHSFHIEIYETDGDLESLYFVIHYSSDESDEYIEKELWDLYEFVREIDKDKILWFVGFVSEIKDV